MVYSQELKNKIIAYYESYYKSCGFLDFQQKAENRLNEEERDAKKIEILRSFLNFDFKGKKHLIVGAGTGGLAVVLRQKYGGEPFGIEPSDEEFEIIKGKCQEGFIDRANFKKEFAEKISFGDNSFDFVYCITVLEHVQDTEKAVGEMLRVLKPGGFLYIETPNYRFPMEKHYKIVFPTFLPKFFGKVYLFLLGKPTGFINSITFLTERKVNKMLGKQENIKWLRIYKPAKKQASFKKALFFRFFQSFLGIYPNQEIIIKKL